MKRIVAFGAGLLVWASLAVGQEIGVMADADTGEVVVPVAVETRLALADTASQPGHQHSYTVITNVPAAWLYRLTNNAGTDIALAQTNAAAAVSETEVPTTGWVDRRGYLTEETDPRLPAHSTAGNLLRSTGDAWESWVPTYVPYTGATADVELGLHNLSGRIVYGGTWDYGSFLHHYVDGFGDSYGAVSLFGLDKAEPTPNVIEARIWLTTAGELTANQPWDIAVVDATAASQPVPPPSQGHINWQRKA